MSKKVREVALDILLQVEKGGAYSNLLLHTSIENNDLPKKDIGLLTEIVYGTIQREDTIAYYLNPFVKNRKKLQQWVWVLLTMSVYQMEFLDRVPDHAIINEAVEIAKKRGHKGIASLVNGVLRSIQREGVPSISEIKDDAEQLAIGTSHPLWLVQEWIEQFGLEETRKICETNLLPPVVTARVNVMKTSVSDILEKYPNAEKGVLSEDAVVFEGGNIANKSEFKEGLLSIQDESSMLVARALGAKDGETILDSCAAPGGKAAHIAERMHNTGRIFAFDLHKHKVKLIKQQAERLGLTNIEAKTGDARRLQEIFQEEAFERVLVDAPCSGFGVIRRKPDIKKGKTKEDILHLANIQQSILNEVAPLVKKGGTLVYSTCTIEQDENSNVVSKFLEKHPEFEWETSIDLKKRLPEKTHPYIKEGSLQILPHYFLTDGFYIACLKRKNL